MLHVDVCQGQQAHGLAARYANGPKKLTIERGAEDLAGGIEAMPSNKDPLNLEVVQLYPIFQVWLQPDWKPPLPTSPSSSRSSMQAACSCIDMQVLS